MTSIAKIKVPSLIEETMEHAFPDVEAGVIPLGQRILLQLKNAATKTKGGIYVGESATQTEFDNTQVAKVIALGPVAYRNRETLELWPEGHWCKVGDFVRIPLYTNSSNTWSIRVPGTDTRTTFTLIDDLLICGIQPDPFYIKAFL